MDLLSLRYFQAVARREHISQAADDLRVAQPSLSRTLARLETELGVPLFDRQGRRVRLNRFGTAFLGRVERALGELDDAQRELSDAAGLSHGSVTVAAETLLTLAEPLRGFLTDHPGVDVRLYQSSAATMTEQLRRGDIDLCLASQPLADSNLTSVELLHEEVLLAVPPTHAFAQHDRVSMDALASQPFITTRPGHWQRALTDHLFSQAGMRSTIVCEGDEPAATLQLISAGLGIGLLPAMGRQAGAYAPVVWLHLDAPECYRTLTVVWRNDAYLSTAAQHFRDHAIQHFQSATETGV